MRSLRSREDRLKSREDHESDSDSKVEEQMMARAIAESLSDK